MKQSTSETTLEGHFPVSMCTQTGPNRCPQRGDLEMSNVAGQDTNTAVTCCAIDSRDALILLKSQDRMYAPSIVLQAGERPHSDPGVHRGDCF